MGAEHSALERKKQEEEQNKKMIQGILAQQRRLYEEKCKEMLQQTVKVCAAKEVTEGGSLQNNNLNTHNATNNYAPLYPKLQVAQNVNVQPSTSRASYSKETANNSQLNMQANAPSSSNYSLTFNSQTSVPTAFLSKSIPASRASPTSAPTASTSRAASALGPSCSPSAPPVVKTNTASELRTRSRTRYGDTRKQGKCSTCGDSLGVKIYQCGEGHSSCMVCKFKESHCGICGKSITDIRNITLESYLAELQLTTPENAVNCPNKSDGCRLSILQSKLEAHLKECLFREMACPVDFLNHNGCTWRGKINQIQAHFLDCHPNQTGADVDTEMSFAPQIKSYIVNYVLLGNFNFLVHLKTDSKFMYCTIQLIGSRTSASKWTYELHIYNKSEPRRKYTYSDICTSNSDAFTDICEEFNCSVLPLPYASTYINNNILTYKFFIKRGKENEVKRNEGPNQRKRSRRPNNKNSD